jgi:Nuclease-related domain
MRIIELSDHPAEMLNDAAVRRRRTEEKARSGHERALREHRARLRAVREKRDRARARHRWLSWLRWALAVSREKRRAPAAPGGAAGPGGLTDQEEILMAGIEGERKVAAELGSALGDDWTLLRGYRNRRGEIDHLLLGPRGLFAIEVKNLNATVHIRGDSWWFDKFDRYGNLVESGQLADRRGRSPSQQLNQPAAELERFLHDRGQQVQVQRLVVLTHQRSQVGTCQKPTVRVGVSAGYVLRLLDGLPAALDARQLAQLARLVQRDHAHHAKRRPAVDGRRPPAGGRRAAGRRRP